MNLDSFLKDWLDNIKRDLQVAASLREMADEQLDPERHALLLEAARRLSRDD